MKVLFATSEAAPLVKTGGLADVSGSLPGALAGIGIDVRVLMPGYPAVMKWIEGRAEFLAELLLPPLPAARLLVATLPSGVPLLVVECPALYDRPGGPYQQAGGDDWPDNDVRFGLLSRVAAVLSQTSSPIDWRPDVLHCNDWQTGLAPVHLAVAGERRAASLFTIHNLAYQGIFQSGTLARLGLPWDLYRVDGVEYYGNISFLKAAIQFSDRITTVSPTYATEIRHEPLGFGMQGLLSWRARDLVGILNGIDEVAWNPGTDSAIARRYGPQSLPRKEDNKRALRTHLGLAAVPGVPLAGVISRFTHQKGLDLIVAIVERALELPVQFAVLGSGESQLEHAFRALAARFPGQVGVQIGFDENLSHLIEAGADFFLMPSRFEPCGLNQMYSQRYGTPVVARATGGLADSITDVSPATLADATGSGFLFSEETPVALLDAITRAVTEYRNRRHWRRIQRAGMVRDFSWTAAAQRYGDLYRSVASGR